jgi:hypothetical protein
MAVGILNDNKWFFHYGSNSTPRITDTIGFGLFLFSKMGLITRPEGRARNPVLVGLVLGPDPALFPTDAPFVDIEKNVVMTSPHREKGITTSR